MIPQWIIEKKRDGGELSAEEIDFFIDGYTRGTLPDYQMSALAMAIYFRGMSLPEITHLTDRMMRSGKVIDASGIAKFKVDKHSTGGIGDKVSLILAPLAACCDVAVPMIAGRGLGISGGTVDKLESILGYRTDLEVPEFLDVVKRCGCSIIGQTSDLAPADRKLYALRDVTATVPSIPLISTSILCKKLAEGTDGLVLDVKWGRGAFMKTRDDARRLARTMVAIGHRMGRKMAAVLTNMDQPLGRTAGNALEVVESIETLKGRGQHDLVELTLHLAGQMLVLAGKAPNVDACRKRLIALIDSGRAMDKFEEMVTAQGGDLKTLRTAKILRSVDAPAPGYVKEVDADAIGRACLALGAGRTQVDDPIDHAVGVSNLVKIGEQVEEGRPLMVVHANSERRLEAALKELGEAVTIVPGAVTPPNLIGETILPEEEAPR